MTYDLEELFAREREKLLIEYGKQFATFESRIHSILDRKESSFYNAFGTQFVQLMATMKQEFFEIHKEMVSSNIFKQQLITELSLLRNLFNQVHTSISKNTNIEQSICMAEPNPVGETSKVDQRIVQTPVQEKEVIMPIKTEVRENVDGYNVCNNSSPIPETEKNIFGGPFLYENPRHCIEDDVGNEELRLLHVSSAANDESGSSATFVENTLVKWDSNDRARKTCPSGISIRPSEVKNGAFGIWADRDFDCNALFGPYEGVIVDKQDSELLTVPDKTFFKEVFVNGKLLHIVDASDPRQSNWLRYVSQASNVEDCNLVQYQQEENIFYRAVKEIKQGDEFVVYLNSQMDVTDSEATLSAKGDEGSYEDFVFENEKQPMNSFKCYKCNVTTPDRQSFMVHIQSHVQTNAYKCRKCDKGFNRPNALKHHMSTVHNKNKPYACKICNLRTAAKSTLRVHMATHTGERRYKCQRCGMSFNRSGTLRRHELLHTGEKPYVCKECSATFRRLSNLKEHVVRIHTKQFPIHCKGCGKGFMVPSSLNKHALRCYASIVAHSFSNQT